MYLVLCVILFTALAFLTVLEHREHPVRWLPLVEWILCGVGVLLHPILLLVLRGFLSTYRESFASWAWDCVTTYLQYALPALGIFCAITFFSALSALWEKRYASSRWRGLRSLCSLAATIVLFAIAGFFAATSSTDELPLAGYIQALGLADGLVLRGMYGIEGILGKKNGTCGR